MSIAEDPATEEDLHAGYQVQLYVDGVEVVEHRLSRTHSAKVADKITLSGSAILKLTRGDVVQIRLKPIGLRAKKYRIPAGGAVMTAQILRRF